MHTIWKGNLSKMQTVYDSPVKYTLHGETKLNINDLINQELLIDYKYTINCIKCGTKTKTSFGQGFCYPCFTTAPEAEECVLRPELCRAHEGIARDMEYANNHCLIDHYVYLAFSGGLKVGITRNTQIPTRWIDQGATRALILAKTPNRYQAGIMEVALKNLFSDKTNWRAMLKNQLDQNSVNLTEEKWKAEDFLPFDMRSMITSDENPLEIEYPVLRYPEKVKSLNLEKTPSFKGLLKGIKGQYLIFDDGTVFNVRTWSGYMVEISA